MIPVSGLPRKLPVPKPADLKPRLPETRPAPQATRPRSAAVQRVFPAPGAPTREFIDLSSIPAGPGADDVDFGANCGSCSKYLAIDDARRADPEFMESYLSGNSFCPLAVPELLKNTAKPFADQLARADSKACSRFQHASFQASDNFNTAVSRLKLLTRGELDVVALMLNSLLKLKDLEDKFGYKINQAVPVTLNNERVQGRVIGFRGRFVIVSCRYAGRDRTVRVVPPAKPVP